MTTAPKPYWIAWAVSGEGKQANWTRIGAAWPHRNDGGVSVSLHALPINGRIVLMEPKEDAATKAGEGAP